MKIFSLTAGQAAQLVNILNLASAVLFLIAAIVPFIVESADPPAGQVGAAIRI